jgi:hypothetical protein
MPGAPAEGSVTKEDLLAAIPAFVERHYPKNGTAAQGGERTPGRGEAAVLLARFVGELPKPEEDRERP